MLLILSVPLSSFWKENTGHCAFAKASECGTNRHTKCDMVAGQFCPVWCEPCPFKECHMAYIKKAQLNELYSTGVLAFMSRPFHMENKEIPESSVL